jgi:hypothetical protein
MSGPSTHNYLTEGYISHTFGPQTTKDYVSNLFGVDAASIQAIRQCDVFYVLNPPSHYIPPFVSPASSVHGRGAWLLDVAVRFSGSVVPQQVWPSQGQGGHCRRVDQTQFRLPVFFTDTNGNFGIPVRDTSAGDMQLYGVNLPPQLLDKTIIKIRLSVCTHSFPAHSPPLTVCMVAVARLSDLRTRCPTEGSDFGRESHSPRQLCQVCGKLLKTIFIGMFVPHVAMNPEN